LKPGWIFGLSLVVRFAAGCDDHKVAAEFFVPDVSASITQQGSDATWRISHSLVQGLHRGDSLFVLPITADAGNDVSGRSFFITAPDLRHREALDQDMEEMRASAVQGIEDLRAQFRTNPGTDTDILGTFHVISEKVHSLPKGTQPFVLVLSDFIQDDRQFNFKTDPRLASPERSRTLAAAVAKQTTCDLHGVAVYLGYLESKDLAPLGQLRRQAIAAFWFTFLSQQGARVTVATDGPGSVQLFLERSIED
jgi:hypothetical protein